VVVGALRSAHHLAMAEPSSTVAPAASAGPTVEHVVADTMRRVHEQLRRGSAPSFEALLAFGEPA
jgi:hypothetical protein